MQVPRDPRPFLGRGEAAVPFGVLVGPRRPALELFDLAAAQPRAVTGEPRHRPHQRADRELGGGQRAVADRVSREVHAEQRRHRDRRADRPGMGVVLAGREQVERDRAAQRWAARVAQQLDRRAEGHRRDQDGHRVPAPGQQRQRGAGGEHDGERVEPSGRRVGVADPAVGDHQHGPGHRRCREREVDREARCLPGQHQS